MSDPYAQRDIARRLEQSQVVERPGASGQTAFYVSGIWTPVLAGSTIAGTFTYDATNTGGGYTRIGNRVLINGRIRITAIAVAPTGNLMITGLPIAATASAFNFPGGVSLPEWRGITLTAGETMLGGRILSSVSQIELMESGSGIAPANVQGGALALIAGVINMLFFGEYVV